MFPKSRQRTFYTSIPNFYIIAQNFLSQICAHHGLEADPDHPEKNYDDTEIIQLISSYIQKRLPRVEDKPSLIEHCFYTVSTIFLEIVADLGFLICFVGIDPRGVMVFRYFDQNFLNDIYGNEEICTE